ncbi:MAG TPA: J domain-containing protein [Solirubrobacteraceae bacterium]|nr:J domain-containing protein [Solirubrobacteraceae bacterium]
MPDPFATLGVDPGVSERELAAAYRRLAKRWHPDRAGGEVGTDERMVALNAAYAQARSQLRRAARTRKADPVVTRRKPPGAWLSAETRKALGWELLTALVEDERVERIASAGGPGRGPIRLVVTDRRLLWLVEDAVTARLDWVRFGLIEHAEVRRPLLSRRRGALLRLRTKTGRRFAFGDIEPELAQAIAARALVAATP